jgi:hypothetical protein
MQIRMLRATDISVSTYYFQPAKDGQPGVNENYRKRDCGALIDDSDR